MLREGGKVSRGKYANSAAATRAREDAINEAEALRQQVAKLTKENTELSTTLATERAAYTSTMRQLNGMLVDATTPEIVALRQRVEDAERIAAEAVHEVGMRVRNAFGNSKDFRTNTKLQVEISDALGITVAEFLLVDESGNRNQRRVSRDRVRSISAQAGHGKNAGQRLADDRRTHKDHEGHEGHEQDFMRGFITGASE